MKTFNVVLIYQYLEDNWIKRQVIFLDLNIPTKGNIVPRRMCQNLRNNPCPVLIRVRNQEQMNIVGGCALSQGLFINGNTKQIISQVKKWYNVEQLNFYFE